VSAYLVAAPTGVRDKQRPGFEEQFARLAGRSGTVGTPVRDLPRAAPRRGRQGAARRAKVLGDVMLIT
jgi:hypothetical protein